MSRVLDALLTPLVPLSFGSPGLRIRARSFAALGPLDGRHAVITGANSGIGRAACEALVTLGAHVTMVCRDEARGDAARTEIAATRGHGDRITVERCDISNLDDVAALADRLRGPLDIVIHNAGVLPASRIETTEGIELTWATHVVGPHLLTRRVMHLLGTTGRVVWVASGGMYLAPLVTPGTVPTPYDGVRAYASTKRAQVVLAELWAEREPRGPRVVSMHPGWADTPSVQSSLPRFHAITRPILRDAAGGADTIAWLAAAPLEALAPGGFYFDRARRATHVWPWQHDRAEHRDALWRWCEELAARHGAPAAP